MSVAYDRHPAAQWAMSQSFNPVQVDCTTTVVLKILDGKCKMLDGEKNAVLAIYDVTRNLPGKIFSTDDHELIRLARGSNGSVLDTRNRIRQLRVYAESKIAKPVMKAYKAVLRDGLFG